LKNANIINNFFSITCAQETKFQNFIDELISYNKHTNLVGKSTLIDPWRSHILDSIQITPFIKNKRSSILDMGTGAGVPGLILSILGYNNVSLVDSNGKKINFIKGACKKLDINANIFLGRIEKLRKTQYKFLISRGLAGLSKLLTYSHNFINSDTVLIFLKGKTINEEIIEASNKWSFKSRIYPSFSDERGRILIIKKLTLK